MNSRDIQFKTDEYYSLKDGFENQFKSIIEKINDNDKHIRELIETKFEAINDATSKALASNDKRLEAMNEFRNTLRDQAGTFVTEKDFNVQHELVRADIESLKMSKATLDGKASNESVVKSNERSSKAYTISIIVALIAAIGLIIEILKVTS